MQHLGHNLSDLRRRCSLRPYRLSISSSFRVILECLKAVEGLHTLGYLHRDLKPSNFAISLKPDDDSIIYMLDYGLCRYYLTKEGAIRPPRSKLGFRGTVRLFELTTGRLPWKMYGDINIVYELKVKFSPEVLCKALPEGLGSFVEHVRSLKYEDRPSYKFLLNCLVCILMKIGAVLDYLYDWQVENCGQRFWHWEIPEMNSNDLP
uniref:Protein kinase domain-containing protein n=1 Tax=Romanomermis culicivorax TaxID=13658 RepID=A0A915K9A9_ROMCU